jgi:hypothetical protein
VLIGALTLGSALPHLIGGLWRLDWRAVLAASAAIAFAGAIMAGALIRPGPQVPLAGRAGRPRSALNRKMRPNEPAITITGRTSP